MNFDKLTEFLHDDAYTNMRIPGCDIAVTKGYEVLYRAQFGNADLEAQVPVNANSQYYLYSCTKPITVAGAMRLVEAGKIDLDAPAKYYLPELEKVFLEKDGVKRTPESTMTVKNLFTMTAGFNYNVGKAPIKQLFESDKPSISVRDFVGAAVKSPLDFEPGARFQYSICHDILAGVVEAVSDMPFGDYQKKYIFEPLEMERTGFLSTLSTPPVTPPLYEVNAETREADLLSHPYRHGLHDKFQSGGAGLISTVEDYIKFSSTMACNGISKNGYRLLKPETIAMIKREQLKNFALNSNFSCAAGAGYGYGLGVRTLIDRSEGQRSPIGEFGWDGAAGSYVLIDTDNNVSIFFATHLCKWPSKIAGLHAKTRDLAYECMEI